MFSIFNFPEKMKESYICISLPLLCLLSFNLTVLPGSNEDRLHMQALKSSLGNSDVLEWFDPDPCKWNYITCRLDRVVWIRISNLNLGGSLPQDLQYLDSLEVLKVASNKLKGPIPNLAGLSSLQTVQFDNNSFSYVPFDFFIGLKSLRSISFDMNPFLPSWEIPDSLKDATGLESFSANDAGIHGTIPVFFGADTFPRLKHLRLALNNLHGKIPSSFAKSSIQTLWLSDQRSYSKFTGSVAVLENMTSLTHIRLDGNSFTGPLPDLSKLISLEELNLRHNRFTGIVPFSLAKLPKLRNLYLANNLLQGPTPDFVNSQFDSDVGNGTNSFCSDEPGVACDSRVDVLLSIAESMGYPVVFAERWKGNDPCDSSKTWKGILCDDEGHIKVVNFTNLGLSGTISPNFSILASLEQLIFSNNSLKGAIPSELTTLTSLVELDVSNNLLSGKVPKFRPNVNVVTDGNPDIEYYKLVAPSESPDKLPREFSSSKSSNTRMIGFVIFALFVVLMIVRLGVFLYTRKRKHSRLWKDLRIATNNFSDKNILGRGGFGTVYKGELPDRTKIAVKRMKFGVVSEQGLTEFKSEIEVLTKVRHCHLVALLGYCLEGDERLLVYEYMPQGSLSSHLFNWREKALQPLEWSRRLSIALDVARGLEYLHGLANQTFIHRDLKPSNILLGDDMRAKIADFGLALLVPDKGKQSIQTRLVGTLGYIAPEYIGK